MPPKKSGKKPAVETTAKFILSPSQPMENAHVILAISMGINSHEAHKFAATTRCIIDSIKTGKISKLTILLGDEDLVLKNLEWQMPTEIDNRRAEKSHALGERWLERHKTELLAIQNAFQEQKKTEMDTISESISEGKKESDQDDEDNKLRVFHWNEYKKTLNEQERYQLKSKISDLLSQEEAATLTEVDQKLKQAFALQADNQTEKKVVSTHGEFLRKKIKGELEQEIEQEITNQNLTVAEAKSKRKAVDCWKEAGEKLAAQIRPKIIEYLIEEYALFRFLKADYFAYPGSIDSAAIISKVDDELSSDDQSSDVSGEQSSDVLYVMKEVFTNHPHGVKWVTIQHEQIAVQPVSVDILKSPRRDSTTEIIPESPRKDSTTEIYEKLIPPTPISQKVAALYSSISPEALERNGVKKSPRAQAQFVGALYKTFEKDEKEQQRHRSKSSPNSSPKSSSDESSDDEHKNHNRRSPKHNSL